MDPIHEQKDANKFMEGGIFYPTGHVVTAFATADMVVSARKALTEAGFEADRLLTIDAKTMAREAQENLDTRGMLSVGASVPTREMQLKLAQEGCHFLVIHAPEDADHERAMQALDGLGVRYAVKYRRLIIENLIPDITEPAVDSEPARVP
ncbi:MAG: hypothetical protein ACT4PZ_16680 [Panacagrimonas sp.]